MQKLIAALTLALVLLIETAPLFAQVEVYDLVISNGRIIDGTGNPWFTGDIAVRGDRIARIGRLGPHRARKRIDASGLVVAPGFIDMLGQSEMSILVDPRAQSKVLQGITTEVTGEGGSIAPLNDLTLKELEPLVQHFKLTVDWRTLDGYFKRLERTPATINLATYVGATQVRQNVLGNDDRAPSPEELDRMRGLVEQAMRDGAVGLSTSLIYAPAFYARTEEIIELAKVAARYGGVYATHMRNEGNSIMQALDEAIRIGREANIPVRIFHLKMAGRDNWGRMKDVIARIEAARASGLDITADQYPYVAGATSLGASIPPWAHEGGSDKLIERLKDPATRERIKREMRQPSNDWENFYAGAGGGSGILVSTILNRSLAEYAGKRIDEIARMMGKEDELDALLDLVIEDNNQASAVYFLMNEEDVKLAMRQPWVSFGTDHGAVATDGPMAAVRAHPRGYGTFPRILGKYVREEKVLTLEEAIRKMTSLAASQARIFDRGLLRPGYFADITIFDPNQISDVATFEDPNRHSVGVRFVVVNGKLVVEAGQLTGARPGRPLRGPGFQANIRGPISSPR